MYRWSFVVLLTCAPLLTVAQQTQIDLALQYVEQHAREFSAPAGAAQEARITAAYTSPSTQLTHVYLRQTIGGIEVRGGDITVTLRPDGSVLHAAGSFFPEVDPYRGVAAGLSAEAAATTVALHLGFAPSRAFEEVESARAPHEPVVLTDGGVAKEPVEARLIYEPTSDGLRLAWDVTFHETDEHHVWSVRLDAATGEVLAQNDYVVHDHWGETGAHGHFARHGDAFTASAPEALWQLPSTLGAAETQSTSGLAVPTYRVFAYPLESPNHGPRTLVSDPSDPQASPFGWHDTDGTPAPNFTISRGNNVFAYVDANNSNQPNGTDAVPDGGEDLVFDFPIDFTQHPQNYRLAAVTNLFYWNNLIHDILHHYGFDEPAGNFQQYNYTGQGVGNDAVRAEAQDGGGMNNANFFTPPDGQAPRMQMYLWNTHGSPPIDGDFDNGVIAHEYAHGWSIRLTGGPNNVSCLWNQEQMGEGWSDYLGLILTMRGFDYAEQVRGIGTFVLNQPINGPGIRPAPYSTSMAVNGYTYGNIGSLSVPHGVGFVWATMLWDMTWNLIDLYGLDLNLIHGNGGNSVALRLVSEAMKLQPCSPGFVDGRDAILAADQALYDGAHALQIWQAFAKRGLGYSATQGSSGSTTDGTEAFDLPPGMDRAISLVADSEAVPAGEFITYSLEFLNGAALDPVDDVVITAQLPEGLIFAPGSASSDAQFDPETRSVAFAVGAVDTGEAVTRTFAAVADLDGGSTLLFEDDMNEGTDGWVTAHGAGTVTWFQVPDGGESGDTAWYARNMPNVSDQYLILEEGVVPTDGTTLRFRHRYHLETRWDGGVVEISVANGPWLDLGPHFVSGGYTQQIRTTATGNPLAGRMAFTGNGGPFMTSVVDLSEFSGQSIRVRFRVGTDNAVGYPNWDGWYVDHVTIIDEVSVTASACAETPGLGLGCTSLTTMVADPLEGAPGLQHDLEDIALMILPDETATVAITVGNVGDRDLDFFAGALGLDGLVVVESASASIEPGGDHQFTLEIDSHGLEPGMFEGELWLVANDPENALVIVPVSIHVSGIGIDPFAEDMPEGYLLESVHPNPFGHSATFTLRVARAQDITITLYDVMGRQVVRVHEGELAAGTPHAFALRGDSLASGVYILSIRGSEFATTQRITRLR